MSRLVLQNWLKPADLKATWPGHERHLRNALEGLDGVRILELKLGQGLLEIKAPSARGEQKLKSEVEHMLKPLKGWKVYEESTYSLPTIAMPTTKR
jgi:hypothetical protein